MAVRGLEIELTSEQYYDTPMHDRQRRSRWLGFKANLVLKYQILKIIDLKYGIDQPPFEIAIGKDIRHFEQEIANIEL
ncbi:hypothetical protein BOTNAR_0107g00020 [Botryotinia narcissicola]|uniref:Uncharacterized protein n=1 Tax=Botryotinia narcissicola TaxID=278944 RepID=A0A4Z1IQH8_9HELO|nr:hypothetical protein BOTNAR_0107g00020 [Botryotinia narcissicola]